MHSNLLLYFTAMSAVSIHNLVSNIQEATHLGLDSINLRTLDTNFSLDSISVPTYGQCNGSRQSPINIDTSRVKENLNLRLGLTAYDKPISGLLINKFPTIQLIPIGFKWPKPSALISSSKSRSFNPYADSHFILNTIQFYWSNDDQNNNPIHTIDDINEYPMELHFIHLNTAYTNIEEALSRPDGLLILSIMVSASNHESYIFDKLLNEMTNITEHNQQVALDEDSTWRSLLPQDTSKFYRYQGSMIFPPCHESVQWVIFEDKLKLGYKQLKRMRQFRLIGRDLRTNSRQEIDWSKQRRPKQQVNDRLLERSFSLQTGKTRFRSL